MITNSIMQIIKLVVFAVSMLIGTSVFAQPNTNFGSTSTVPTSTSTTQGRIISGKNAGRGAIQIAYFNNAGELLDSNGNIIKAALGYTPADSSLVVKYADTPAMLASYLRKADSNNYATQYDLTQLPANNGYTRAEIDAQRDSTYRALPLFRSSIVPRNKTGETYPSPLNLNIGFIYWEVSNRLTPTSVLKSVTLYAQTNGWARIVFVDTFGATSIIKYSVTKQVTSGVNTFTTAQLYIPDSIKAMPELFVGVTNFESSPAPMVYTTTLGAPARFTPQAGGAITNSTLNINYSIEVANRDSTILEKLQSIKSFSEQVANYNLSGTLEATPFNKSQISFGTPTNSAFYYADPRVFIGRAKRLEKLFIKAAVAGDVNIALVKISGNNASIIYSTTKTVAFGINAFTPTDLSLPDISAYDKLYIFVGNNISSPAPFCYTSTGATTGYYSLNKSSGLLVYNAGLLQFGYWIEDLNVTVPLFDAIQAVKDSIPVVTRIKTYAQLLAACSIAGNHVQILNDTIDIPNRIHPATGVSIVGIGNASLLRMSDTNTQGIFNMQARSDWSIRNLAFQGEFPNVGVTNTDTTYIRVIDGVRSIDDAINNRNMGTSVGILIGSSERGIIENIIFKNFSKAGIEMTATGNLSPRLSQGMRGNNLLFESCYNTIYGHSNAEYSQFSQISAKYCVIGYRKSSGNLALIGSQIVHCIVGYINTVGGNDSHGNSSSLQINHSHPYAMIFNGITGGETVGNLTMFDGTIVIRNSNGVNINGGNISGSITVDGGGWNSITNTAFLRAPDNTPIDTVNSPLVQLCDNYFRDYDDHTVLNNCLMATYVSSASSLTLGYNSHYSFNGTTGTWTLPAISSLIKGANKVILIKNRGTGSLTINTSGGLNTLFDGSATNNIILGVGEKAMLFPDGTYINVE